MKIKTRLLQEAVALLDKAAGKNKIIPITQMIGLVTNGTKLTLATTDTFNSMYLTKDTEVELPALDVCTNLEIFTKLVNKITTEDVEFIIDGNALTLKGNGEYKLELTVDEEGELFKFPKNDKAPTKHHKELVLNVSKLEQIKQQCNKALAVDLTKPVLMNYAITKDSAFGTDTYNISKVKTDVAAEEIIIPSKLMDLICLLGGEVKLTHNDNNYVVTNNDIRIFSKVSNIENYPIEKIDGILNNEVDCTGTIEVPTLLSLLERISIMISTYDKEVIALEVVGETINISSLKSSGVETISYKGNTNTAVIKNYINVNSVINQLNTISDKEVTLTIKDGLFVAFATSTVNKLVSQVEYTE